MISKGQSENIEEFCENKVVYVCSGSNLLSVD